MSETDQALLGRYARDGSEDAFAEIVRRHVDLVYAVALREVRSPQLAEEIVQAVFQDLARQASKLRADTAVAGWLHLVAYRTAVDAIRREARRYVREKTAIEMNALNAPAEPWPEVEPLLDAAVAALSPNDRAAVVLRYFENRPLSEVGDALNISEDAAQKRVGRAVDRLRDLLAGHGVCISVGGLTTVVTANAVGSAPAGLAGTVLSAILVSGEATAIAVGTAAATGWLTAKTTTAVLAVGLVVGSGTILFQQRELRRVQSDLSNAWATNNVLTETVEKTVAILNVQVDELEQGRKDQAELARLRNRVGQLQRELEDFRAPSAQSQPQSTNANQSGGVFPGQSAGLPAPPVSEWAKVKIDATGAVFLNKRQMTSDEFRAECVRLKNASGAIVLFVDTSNRVASPAQAAVIRQIADAGVLMKAALKESELD